MQREPFVTFLPRARTGRFHILDWRPPPPPPPPLGTPRRRPAEGMTPRRRLAEGRQARCRARPDSWPREKHRSAVVRCAVEECSSVIPDIMILLIENVERLVKVLIKIWLFSFYFLASSFCQYNLKNQLLVICNI